MKLKGSIGIHASDIDTGGNPLNDSPLSKLYINGLKNIPYPQQIQFLYKQGFTPENLTGEQEIIVVKNKAINQALLLYKGIGVFSFRETIFLEDAKFIYIGGNISGFEVQINGNWYLYFRDKRSYSLKEPEDLFLVQQIKNGLTDGGEFENYIDLHQAKKLLFGVVVSSDTYDILEGNRY